MIEHEHAQELQDTAREIVSEGRGILAADESTGTITKRFEAVGIESTEESRRAYRQLLFTADGAGEFISGAIMYDETIRQSTDDGTPFPKALSDNGTIPGIKVDTGAKPLALSPDEKVTEGLDGLRERLEEYRELGARFCKWRGVIQIGDGMPTPYCLDANAHALARYAALCQEAGLVPIVEPEVMMDGDHPIERCYEVTSETLHRTFDALFEAHVMLEGLLLKPNMVLPGKESDDQKSVEEVAQTTVDCMRTAVPAAVPGIVFLSGGQGNELATARLNAMNEIAKRDPQPWELAFSYARALQEPPMETWCGQEEKVSDAQAQYYHRARLNGAARKAEYSEDMEKELAPAA
ncbi:MAG: fructose-bisphosphate aldolase class I [Actinomycetota bacterium]|nr:fructose-bisphosphate aldolase class I [Actinomycetota bacterium]